MGILDKVLGRDRLKAQLKAYQSQFSVQYHNQIYPTWQSFKEVAIYKVIDDIYSVVNRLANAAASVPMYAYNETTMEDIQGTHQLSIFIKKFTFKKRVEMFTWLYLRGECFMYKDKYIGAVQRVEKLTFLNPSFVTLVISNTFPEEVVKYIYCDAQRGIELSIELDEIIHLKYFNPDLDFRQSWRGLSPCTVLAKRLTRLNAGMDASVAQMQNGGVPGIVYEKSENITYETHGLRIDKYSRYSNNPSNKGAPYFAVGELGYIQLGLPLADLTVAELGNIDFKKICNVYNVSDTLFNSDAASTESNVIQMRQMMWTNAVIPNLTMVEDEMNETLVVDFGDSLIIKFDISAIKDLQKNQKEMIDTMAAAPVMIPNDVLEALGYERNEDPAMDEPLIKTGYQPISDFEALPPIE